MEIKPRTLFLLLFVGMVCLESQNILSSMQQNYDSEGCKCDILTPNPTKGVASSQPTSQISISKVDNDSSGPSQISDPRPARSGPVQADTTTISDSHKSPALSYPPGRRYQNPSLKPTLGKHRWDADDVVFAMATGYEIDDHLMTIGSLLATNFTGDIVLGIQDLRSCSPALQAFLKYHSTHSNLVAYAIEGCGVKIPTFGNRCEMKKAYSNPYDSNKKAADLSGRHQSPRKFRYEHYWIWLQNYSPTSRILVSDFRDLVFQTDPFRHWSLPSPSDFSKTMFLFEESNLRRITERERFTADMIAKIYGPGMIDRIGNETVICSGVTMGGKVAMEQYLLLMIWDMDNVLGNRNGKGDQAHHNVLYYTGQLQNQTGIDNVTVWKNFEGAVATTGYTYQHTFVGAKAQEMRSMGVLGNDGLPSAIVHQFDRSRKLNKYFKQRRDEEWQIQAERLTGQNMTHVAKPGEKKPS